MSRYKAHAPHFNKRLGRTVCDKCGLIYLKNAATAKAIGASCPGSEGEKQ